MMHFWWKTYRTSLDAEGIKKTCQEKFDVEEKKNSLKLKRVRLVPNRGFIRVMIPGLTLKAVIKTGEVKVKMRLDGIAIIFMTVFIMTSIFTFTLDPDKYPREYPDWAPFALLGWYLLASAIEIWFTSKVIKSVFGSISKDVT